MNSVQENKNELEAAVRYCESAISRAKATIESMEFRQQAASKAWHEQTGREAALEREVSRLRAINEERNTMIDEAKEDRAKLVKKLEAMTAKYDRMKGYADQLLDENGTMEDKYEEAKTNMALLTDENLKLRETNNLQKDQIAMFQRKMSRMNEMQK